MSARHGPWTGSPWGEGLGEESSLAAVRDSEALVDLLASRVELRALDGAYGVDPLAVALAGWVRTLDVEVDVATSRRPLAASAAVGARRDGRVLPVHGSPGDRQSSRGPWRAMSASAAAVIAMLTIGVGLQDAAQVAPTATVAESVQSVEATLTASLMAAESGDVAGAGVLLEQARAMVASLPETERARWERAVGRAEQGLRTAEEAIRQGRPVPDLDGRTATERDRAPQGDQGRGDQGQGGQGGGGGADRSPEQSSDTDRRPAPPPAPAPSVPPRATTVPTTTATGAPAPTTAPTPSPTSTTAAPVPTPSPTEEPGDQGRRPVPSPGPGSTPGTTPGAGQGAGQGDGQGRRPSGSPAGRPTP